MILVVILLFHDKRNKKLYETIFFSQKNLPLTILQQYINYIITISVVRLMSVCCPLNKRTTNEEQTHKNMKKGIVKVEERYRNAIGYA